jgi:hypothetical protein
MERMQLQAERFELGGKSASIEWPAAPIGEIVQFTPRGAPLITHLISPSFRGARSSREPGIQKSCTLLDSGSAPKRAHPGMTC